jgi:tetratricopeptide (TPR) repeat protein
VGQEIEDRGTLRSKRTWIIALLAVVLGFGTWLALRVLGPGPASLPPDFPVRPDLKSANAALKTLIDTTDLAARSIPASASKVGRLGMVYHANQFYDQAQAAYVIASRLDPKDYRWVYYQVLLAEERGQDTSQPSLLAKVLQLKPDFLPVLQKQGDIFLKQGQFEKAALYYRKARGAAGGENSPQARFGAARVAQRRGDWAVVIENLEPVVRDYPHVRPAHQLLAEAYEALGQSEKAAAQRAILVAANLTPMPPLDDPLYQDLVQVSCSSTRLLKEAGLLTRFGHWEEAIRVGRRAVEVEPGDADAHHFVARSLLDSRGADSEAVHEALVQLNEGLRLRPDDLVPLFYFATFFFREEKTDVAVEELRSMLASHPASAEAQYYLGVVAGRKGQVEEAFGHYQEALRINPKYAEPCDKLGQILMQQGQIEAAVAQFQKAVQLKPTFTRARCNLGVALEQQGRVEEAIKQYEEALREKPNDGSAQMYLAIALLKTGKVQRAVDEFRNAVRLAPEDPEGHYGLGFALVLQGQAEAARKEFQEALRLRPGYEEARLQLEKLERKK